MKKLISLFTLCFFCIVGFFACQKSTVLTPEDQNPRKRSSGFYNAPDMILPQTPADSLYLTQSINNFVPFIGDKLFLPVYSLNSFDIKHLLKISGGYTIALYNALYDSGDYSETNKAYVVVPVSSTNHTIMSHALLFNANGTSGPVSPSTAMNLINNYSLHENRDEIRGIFFPRNAVDILTENSDTQSLVYHGMSSARNIVISTVNGSSVTPRGFLTDRRICPNNCDFY